MMRNKKTAAKAVFLLRIDNSKSNLSGTGKLIVNFGFPLSNTDITSNFNEFDVHLQRVAWVNLFFKTGILNAC